MRKYLFTLIIALFILLSISSAADLYQQGIELLKQQKYAEATAVFEQYLATDSTNAKAYYNLGLAYANVNKITAAVDAWKKAILINPDFEEAHYNLGLIYNRPDAYHTPEAIQEFQTVLKLNPNNYKAAYQLAGAYFRLGNHADAIQELDKSLAINPEFLAARSLKVSAYQMVRNYSAAITEAKLILQKENNEANKSVLFNLYLTYGTILRTEKKYQAALTELYIAQKMVSNHPQVQYELANTYAALGQLQNAETLFEYVLARDPNSLILLNNIAYFYADNNIKLDRATLLIDSAIRILPIDNEAMVWVLLDTKGWIEFRLGNYENAYILLGKGLNKLIEPYQPEPGLNEKDLAAFLAVQPNYELFPEVMQVRYHLALVAWQLDKKEECRQVLDQIIAVNTSDPAGLEWQQKAKDWLGEKK